MGDVTTFSENGQTGKEFFVPAIYFSPGNSAYFTLKVRQYDADPLTVQILSEGRMAEIKRVVAINYQIKKDTSILNFSVASKSPIEITDNSTIGLGIYTDWGDPSIVSPITLAGISTIEGDINTVLSPDDFAAAGYTLEEMVSGTYEELNYNQPEVDLPTSEDFDTSSYAKEVSVLSAGGTTKTKEYYPHAPGSYTMPVLGSTELNRTVYENMVIADKRAISGDALFRNCTFSGIFYVGTSSGIGTNNVRFENCTFNGPIITGVPPKFGVEEWKKNCLYFTGNTVFNNSVLSETTILAPNYNVDIGNATGDSAITGIILGGVVDVRGDATIDGTIVSMADPLELGTMAGLLDTSIGISDVGGHTVDINPSPENLLPIGMASKIIFVRDSNSYVEF